MGGALDYFHVRGKPSIPGWTLIDSIGGGMTAGATGAMIGLFILWQKRN
jgi:hypothetical protein